ncbi:MAG: hypothetical protein ACI9VS_000770 [Candidatus Binatia bacterium]
MRKDLPVLTPEADRLWSFLKERRILAGFVLLGGSALSLRIHHRVSEDLDFAYLAEKLPVRLLDQLQAEAAAAGIALTPDDDEAAMLEFSEGGLELRDYQQDFIGDGRVKVSFFAANIPLKSVLRESTERETPRLAELSELFQSKCLVCAMRSKSRDWFDLYVLMRDHGFLLADMEAAFREAGVPNQFEPALARLCSGKISAHDEGYSHLLDDAPSLDEIRDFFRRERDAYESSESERARGKGRACDQG